MSTLHRTFVRVAICSCPLTKWENTSSPNNIIARARGAGDVESTQIQYIISLLRCLSLIARIQPKHWTDNVTTVKRNNETYLQHAISAMSSS
jgi:hypothetical protein